MASKGKEMELMRKMSRALMMVLFLATMIIPFAPALAAEPTQEIQGIEIDHSAVQDEVNANLNSLLNTTDDRPLCQVPENGLRFDVRGCEKNPQWSLLKW
ncbi:MAG: hypothetical protein ACE5I0_05580 [Candidatus Binatia bacterium]